MTDFNDETLPDRRPLILRLIEKRAGIEAKNKFAPIKTLGTPRKGERWYENAMAMDSCFRNVLSRSLNNQISYEAYSSFIGYGMLSNLTQEALIRAGVETIADDMTRKHPELYYDDDGDGKEDLINTINSEMFRYKIKSTINDAMQKDGYFGGCLVYIDVGDLEDDEAEEPLVLDKKTFSAGSFRGLKVIEPVNIAPGDYNTTNPTDKNYFKPEWYYILGKRYHASRFLYIASNDAPLLLKPAYNFFGIPQAQLALDYVANYIANRESAQELLNKFSLTGFGTDLSQALQQDGSWADIINRIKAFNKFKTNNGTFVYNKETEELMQLNTPLSGVRDIVEMSMNCLTAVWRIPKVRYIGEGDGGLNASTDGQLRSYYDYILALQEKVLMTPYEKIIRILQLNKGLEPDDKLLFKFPYLWEMDEKERAELNKIQADRDAVYLANGVVSQEECRRRLSLDRYSGFTDIDINDIPDTQEQPLENTDKEEQDEEDRQAMDEWVESEHPRDEEGKFTDKNGSSSGGLLDGVDFYDIEAAKDYINIPNRFKEDAEGWDNQKSVKKIARILENPVMSEMWNRVESLDKEKEKKKEIIDHISRNEYIATPETLMFYLYDGFDRQTTVKDFMKKYNVYDETYIKQMLAGLSVNYPEFINFSDTLGLDTINLKKSKSEKRDYYTIKIVDENGDLYDEKTVLASKSLIKKIYGNKVSSIQKETKKMRIDGAESLFESEEQQAQDIAMDSRWITIGARKKAKK